MKYAYHHLPKTGGRSVRVMLKAFCRKTGHTRHSMGHYDRLLQKPIPEQVFLFATVRHPIDRFISAWNYANIYNGPGMAARLLQKYLESKWNNINDFVLSEDLLLFQPTDILNRTLCSHFLPLTAMMYPLEKYDLIIKMEEFDKQLPLLFKGKINTNVHEHATGGGVSLKDLSKESIDRLNEFYSDDFDKLGYSKWE